ncbi:MAG: permease-like cell division protein FtsX [Cellulosilyticaceae bacterium]
MEDTMMKWHTIKYLCKEGILGLWKNRLMALASAGTIVLCLLILGMSYSVAKNIDYILGQIETQMGITTYINNDVSEERTSEIASQIQSIPHVIELEYISKEKALEIFAGDQESNTLFEQFKDDNPLPASFELQVDEVENQEAIVQVLSNIPELQITYFEKETDMFIVMNKSIKLLSVGVIGCLIIIALLLITNTIKLTVYVRRREINIMKYIGATDAFIRLPFLVEGITIGIIGCVIPIGLIHGAYNWAAEMMTQSLSSMLGGLTLQPINEIMNGLVPIFALLGIGIGALGSAIAIHKHLKV